MKIVVIGGTGHIGSYLVPRLVRAGHEVVVLSRGNSKPYSSDVAWQSVRSVSVDREAQAKSGTFGLPVASFGSDVVIDLICFTLNSAVQLAAALKDKVSQLLVCGTIWINGISEVVPFKEEHMRNPFGSYGIQKAEMTDFLLKEARQHRLPVTIVHPGHIVGKGWVPLNPQGNFNLEIWKTIKAGKPLLLPNNGLETVHHVHADDVASVFINAMHHWSAAVGEQFIAVSPQAITLNGYAQAAYRWFGHQPDLEFEPWQRFSEKVSKEDAAATWDHIHHSPCASIEKATRLLEYVPRYSSFQAIEESVRYLETIGKL